jgi:hypothetical protein
MPIACAFVGSDRQICTWHVGRSHHLVCVVDPQGRIIEEPCLRHEDNTSMRTFPNRKSKHRSSIENRNKKEALRREAKAALDGARGFWQVIQLVGAGPSVCLGGEVLRCRWHAVRRTPGFITLSRIANTRGKRLELACTFTENGESRGHGSCQVHVEGRGPTS